MSLNLRRWSLILFWISAIEILGLSAYFQAALEPGLCEEELDLKGTPLDQRRITLANC